MYIYQNYHRHSFYSNPRISDSVASNEDYAKRAVELGHGIISTCEHGSTGRYIEGYELAEKYDLRFVFAVEAYWVKDRAEKDRTNCHIMLVAKNENGRQAINDIMSEAAITGFYGQPRVDIELIMSLPADDVFVTTACIAYWRYDDIDEITKMFAEHFGDNFFLEVQYHNTDSQKQLNEHILKLADLLHVKIIMGCDSHYIDEAMAAERNDFLLSKGMHYDDEEGWYLDYPDGDTAYKRFAQQGVLSHQQILAAMENTNVMQTVSEYCNPCFTHDIKMPTLYPNETQEERDARYERLIWDAWEKEKNNIDDAQWSHYEREIQKEIDTVKITKHADYFLMDHAIVKRAREIGGVLTTTGRGSAPSFYTNKLLGLTEIDRIAAKVHMYPERFMSATRILETKSLADIDLNTSQPEKFAQAQIDVFGEGHSFPMIAYGTMKPKAAWKMYAKSQDVDFEIANIVSQQIDRYEYAVKVAPDDERDMINIEDYIDVQYHQIYQDSVGYQGVIVSASIHPCSYLLYQGDIRKEIGLTRAKENIVCCMDGKWAEQYKFLKNDLLKVLVVSLISDVYKRIGRERDTVDELLKMCDGDSKVWDLYKRGCTLGLNQVEQEGTRQRVMKYAPTNISELCAFVAAIRPGFKSLFKVFADRQPFSYGIKSLDDIIQTDEMKNSFILYQEMSMAVLNYAGIPMSECYDVIKNIAKKRVDKVLAYRDRFLNEFARVLVTGENMQPEESAMVAEKVWQVLEDSSRYSYNASHSYSVAIDSLYGAYLKAYYPLQFYEVFLTMMQEKGDKDRMQAAKEEAESYFNIKFPPLRFGQDNRSVVANIEANQINNSLVSIKGFGQNVADKMYECWETHPRTFIEALSWLDAQSIKSAKIIPLIKIDYFARYGNIPTLLSVVDAWDFFRQGAAKKIAKDIDNPYLEYMANYATDKNAKGETLKAYTISDCMALIMHIAQQIEAQTIPDWGYAQKASAQLAALGFVDLTTDLQGDRRKLMITNVVPLKDKTTGVPWGYRVMTKSIGSGKTAALSIRANTFKAMPVRVGDILYGKSIKKNDKGYWYLFDYDKIDELPAV